jgi:hypothetical protein
MSRLTHRLSNQLYVPEQPHETDGFYYDSDDRVFEEHKSSIENVRGRVHQRDVILGHGALFCHSHSPEETDSPPKLLFPTEEVERLRGTDDKRQTSDEENL